MIHRNILERDKNLKKNIIQSTKKRSGNLIICCMVIMILMLGSISPNIVHAAEKTSKEGGEINAFYPAYAKYSEQIQKYIDDVDSLCFAWSRIDADNPGLLNTTNGQNNNTKFYYPKDYLQPITYAKSKGKSIQLSIFMSGSDCAKLLPDSEKQEQMIKAISESMQKDISQGQNIYYDGVVIDFEGLRDTDGNKNPIKYKGKQISTYFTQFLTQLKEKLTANGKKLYVAVNPRLYFDGYDYSAILKVADRVIIMAHDYEPAEKLTKNLAQQYTGFEALKPVSSMAPIQMIRQALNDIQSSASHQSDLSKVWLQLCFDSAQWKYDVSGPDAWKDLDATTLSKEGGVTPIYKQIKSRADNTDGIASNLTHGYNNELQTPYIQYYNKSDKTWNIILYEDSNSITAKINQAKSYGLGGISIWSLSNVPDYNDANGKKYHLDGWSTIKNDMDNFTTMSADSKQKVSFKDGAVEQAVRDKLFKPTGNITKADLKSIYRLKLTNGTKSISDLKNLPNLEYLDASNLNLKNISTIGSLKNLRVLYLQRNKITDISYISKLTHLKVLSLNGNNIVSLKPLAKLTNLEKLYLRENKITNIANLKALKNLKELYLSSNHIADYSPVKKIYAQLKGNCDFKLK